MARYNYKELGFGAKKSGEARLVNKDGSFNVKKVGVPLSGFNPYQFLLSIPFWKFITIVLAIYLGINAIFAFIYHAIGIEHFSGVDAEASTFQQYMQLYFFSAQTLTTVGYGSISPHGNLASLMSSIEALFGLLLFAIATGLFYGRFAKPNVSLLFSPNALIAPFKEGKAWMFRVANKRDNQLIELEAQVTIGWDDIQGEQKSRQYAPMELQVSKINFFPLNWTLVHPIDENSPLYGKTEADFLAQNVEFYIIFKGYDDTFFQVVYSRHSYTAKELVWDAKFRPAFTVDSANIPVMDMEKIGDYDKI